MYELINANWNVFVGCVLWLVFTLIIVIYFSINTLPGILYAMSQKEVDGDAHVTEEGSILVWEANPDDYRYWQGVSGDCRVAATYDEFVEHVAGTPVDEEQWDNFCRQ